MNYWWTSDYHFSHFNIIRYCNRPAEGNSDGNPPRKLRVLLETYG